MIDMPLAITAGEPAGIGLDIILQSVKELTDCIVIADQHALSQRAETLNLSINFSEYPSSKVDSITVKHVPTRDTVECGKLSISNAAYVLACIDEAINGTLNGRYAGIVTAPLHKGIINDAGIEFTGHTEYLAQKTNSDVVMLLVAGQVRVALVTTHLPLSEVPQAINQELIIRIATILNNDLQSKFGLVRPQIAVCGLNPHAGEQGHLGREEIDIIEPAIRALQDSGVNASGPYPADTIFTPKQLQSADAVLAMYHDQGLPTLKHIGFGNAVNTTLGLPVIRTSVDHGTALELAGTGKSDNQSLISAIRLARAQVGKLRY